MAFILSLLIAAAASVAPAGYTQAGQRDGVTVYLKKDSAIVDLVAVGDFAATPAEVERALLSYDEQGKLMKRVSHTEVLSRGEHELVVYQQLDLPVIANRDYTLVVDWKDSESGMRFHVDNGRGPAAGKRVHMTTLEGSWELSPADNGHTHAVYRVRMDLGGSAPKGMVKNGSVKEMPELFAAYEQLIERHRMTAHR